MPLAEHHEGKEKASHRSACEHFGVEVQPRPEVVNTTGPKQQNLESWLVQSMSLCLNSKKGELSNVGTISCRNQ